MGTTNNSGHKQQWEHKMVAASYKHNMLIKITIEHIIFDIQCECNTQCFNQNKYLLGALHNYMNNTSNMK